MKGTMRLKGLRQTKRKLKRYADAMPSGLDAITQKYLDLIAADARPDVPNALPDLRASIRTELQKAAREVIGYVTAGEGLDDPRISGWVEFGTGERVEIPPGLEAYAMTFYVNGLGRTPAHPYMYPAFFRYMPKYVSEVIAYALKVKK